MPLLLPIVRAADFVISALSLFIFASVILSWLPMLGIRVPRYHPIVQAIEQIADLVLRPIRRAIPSSAGGLDFSPMIAIIVLQVARAIMYQLVRV